MSSTDESGGGPDSRNEHLTISFRRSHLYGAAGLVVGLSLGYALATWRSEHSGAVPPVLTTTEQPSQPTAADPRASVAVPTAGRPSVGSPDAPVTIVEFTDYQCPFCRTHFEQTLPALLERYRSQIRYIVLNFPIPSLHPEALKASEAAECAFDQTTFWDYHDRLFREQRLDPPSLKRYAAELSLDTAAFNRCLDSGLKAEIVRRDMQDGSRLGVRGTPVFFVNGRRIDGAQSLDVFAVMIQEALARGGS